MPYFRKNGADESYNLTRSITAPILAIYRLFCYMRVC